MTGIHAQTNPSDPRIFLSLDQITASDLLILSENRVETNDRVFFFSLLEIMRVPRPRYEHWLQKTRQVLRLRKSGSTPQLLSLATSGSDICHMLSSGKLVALAV